MYKKLDKSSDRLAMEIKGKDRVAAESHLVKFGASVAGSAAAVAMCIGIKSKTVAGSIHDISYCIETNC